MSDGRLPETRREEPFCPGRLSPRFKKRQYLLDILCKWAMALICNNFVLINH
jgi:hypothetical protein